MSCITDLFRVARQNRDVRILQPDLFDRYTMESTIPLLRTGSSKDSHDARLIDAGLRSLRAIAREWGLDDQDVSRLLGDSGRSNSTFDEVALRLSHLLGIHRSLVALFGQSGSRISAWMHAANSSVPFGGSSPKHVIVCGDHSRLGAIRSYLECQLVL